MYRSGFVASPVHNVHIWAVVVDNALPETKNMDGVINYLIAILDQKIVNVYNLHHMACMTMKIAQGFFERELFYPARMNNKGPRVDLTGAERNSEYNAPVDENTSGHGTQIPGIDLHPRMS